MRISDWSSDVCSSDLETADIIAGALGVAAVARYAGLRERAYGEAEGLDAEEFHARRGEWHTAQVHGAEPWQDVRARALQAILRSEEHTSELQSLMRISYADLRLKKKQGAEEQK